MQVAPQAATLLLTCLDEPLPGVEQVRRERLGMHRSARLTGQIGQHEAVAGVERDLATARRRREVSDDSALVRQRPPLDRPVTRLSAGGQKLVVGRALNRHVWEPERLRHRRDHGGEHVPGLRDSLEPATHVAQRPVRIVALAVEVVVDQSLAAVAGGPHRHRRDQRGDEHSGPLRSDRRAHGSDGHVDTEEDHGHQAIDGGAPDDRTDVPQVVEHDRDRQCRDEEQPSTVPITAGSVSATANGNSTRENSTPPARHRSCSRSMPSARTARTTTPSPAISPRSTINGAPTSIASAMSCTGVPPEIGLSRIFVPRAGRHLAEVGGTEQSAEHHEHQPEDHEPFEHAAESRGTRPLTGNVR